MSAIKKATNKPAKDKTDEVTKPIEEMNFREFSRAMDGVTESGSMLLIPPSLITADPGWNKRVRDAGLEAHIDDLFQNLMAGKTFADPLQVYKGADSYIIVDGHCRWEAACLAVKAGKEKFRLRAIQFAGNDIERLNYQYKSQRNRKLSQYEQSLIVKEYVNLGLSPAAIADELDCSRTHVDNLLIIANAPYLAQMRLHDGLITQDFFFDLWRKFGDGMGAKILQMDSRENPVSGEQPKKLSKRSMPSTKFGKKLTEKIASTFLSLPNAIQAEMVEFTGDPEKVDTTKIYDLRLSGETLKGLLEIAAQVSSADRSK